MNIRRPARVIAFALAASFAFSLFAQTPFRKIGELNLYLRGISAGVDPLNPVVPKNTPAGVRIIVRSGDAILSADEVTRFAGGAFRIEGDYSGPGLRVPVALPYSGGESVSTDPLLLALPPVTVAGDYQLTNLRLTVNGRSVLDVQPSHITVKVIDQVLITSVTTKPLTLDEIKARGVVIDSNSYLGFEFTVGVTMDSKQIDLSFPVVFDSRGVAIPQPLQPPPAPSRAEVPLPTIIPMLLKPADGPAPVFKDDSGHDVEVRIPSVLVIPGNVGYLKQFFSAQLFVANGAPGGSGLVVRDITGTIKLPPGADQVVGTADDPLSLPDKVSGPQPSTLSVAGPGLDGVAGTPDDTNRFQPGEQGQAEFVIRGEKEGFQQVDFDINATLDGLATGSVKVAGAAHGGVLVRNPFFDMSFTVPAVARKGEQFKVYVTVNNISQAIANDVRVTLDASRMSGATLVSDATQSVPTIAARDSKTLEYTFRSERTGQVVASYLHFDTQNGSTGNLNFTLAVGERGVPLSPDTIALPSSVASLPQSVVDAAMRVIGQGWSIANAPGGTLPANVIRTTKTVVTQRALALAEAGLRVDFGQPVIDAVRDLVFDFGGASSFDAGFDQLMRQTDAGSEFARATGAALRDAVIANGGVVPYERTVAQLAASGSDFATFAVGTGTNAAPVSIKVTDALARSASANASEAFNTDDVASAIVMPIGNGGPMVGVIPVPGNGPYKIELIATANASIDFSASYTRNGTVTRAFATALPVVAGGHYRATLDRSATLTSLAIDADGDGTYESTQPLSSETLFPQGARALSATMIGPETIAGASPFGFQMALLFDRIVDPASAATVANYTIASNRVLSAKSQLSGRLVFATLQQPEGPYVATSISINGVRDGRGVNGPAATVNVASRLKDIGAVVTGRVLNADGSPVSNVQITYAQNPILDCAPPLDDYAGLTNVVTRADGHYELRYVRQDACGMPFQILTNDPQSGSLRTVSSSVRMPGEQIVLDIALFGRGSVVGTVKDLRGVGAPGATVRAISDTDPQVGGTATTDLAGRYRIDNMTVGAIRVSAVSGLSAGRSFGRIDRAGTATTVNVTLDGGTVSVSGTVRKLETGVVSAIPALQVVYYTSEGGTFVPIGVTQTSTTGVYTFDGMPTGEFRIDAALNTRDRASASGIAAAGDHITQKDILITVASSDGGTVRGVVKMPDGTPAPNVIVSIDDRGVLSGPDGRFELPGVQPRSNASQLISARSRDGLRATVDSVIVSSPGQIVDNVVLTLSGLGSIDVTVLNFDKTPVIGQEVALLGGCDNDCGCSTAKTGSDGHAHFDNLPLGSVRVKATRGGSTFIDQTVTTVSIPRDGATGFGVMTFAGAGTVMGTVLDPDGHAALGADVALVSRVFDEETCSLVAGISHRVRTDSQGQFRFNNVNVGSVSVTVTHPFYPSAAGAQGTLLKSGDVLNFSFKLTNTIAGELSGTVFLPDGVTPAGSGVEVTANGALPDVTVTTDANGAFHFAKIFPAGAYSLTAQDPVTGGLNREQIYLQAGQDLHHDVRLKGRGTVEVRVVDGADQPVANAFVRLQELDYPNRTYEAAIEPASGGVATFENVFEGRVSAQVSDVFARGGRASSVLARPGDTLSLKVALTVTGKVRGHFVRADATTPIPFGSVTLIAGSRVVGTATTDGGGDPGAFAFDYVPAGPVRIEAQDPLTARSGVAAGSIVNEGDELNLTVVAQGLGAVTGVVTSNGAPQPAAHVDINNGSFHVTTIADENGRYRIDGVPEGLISATASIDGSFLAGTNSAPLAGDGTTLTLDVAMRGSGKLTGHVLLNGGVTPSPLAVVTVQVGGAGGATLTQVGASDGSFTFDRVPAGGATVSAEVPGTIDRGKATTDVIAGGTTDVSVVLNGIGSVAGHTLDSNGQPIGGDLTMTGIGAFPYTIALKVGSDGTFTLPQVLAGPYTASLRAKSGEFTLYGTASGQINANVSNNVSVQLQPSGTVTGLVVRADGATLAIGANVTLSLLPNRGTVVVQTGSDGRFTATGVPLGALSIRIDDPLTGGVAIASGLTLQNNGDTLDAGRLVLDDTPVAVVSIDPAAGATGIPTDRAIVITFTDPIMSASGISVLNGTQAIGLASTLSVDGKVVTLSGRLPDSAQITVNVSTALTDVFGRHPAQSFTASFQTVDLSPPSVSAIDPVNDSVQVGANTTVKVTFSEPLGSATNLSTLVTVTAANGIVISGTTAAQSPNVVVFTPAAPFASDSVFNVSVLGAIDASGNAQTFAFTSHFATTDTGLPTLMPTQPLADWVNTGRPLIQFVGSDNVSGIAANSGTLSIDGVTVGTTFGGTIAFIPATPLAEGAHNAQATIRDRAGNVGTAGNSFGVDTVAPSVPVLSGITEGQIIKGTVALTAASTDAGSGVANIQFIVDGVVRSDFSAPSFSTSFNTTSLSEGPHTFTARAVDVAGNSSAASQAIHATVDNAPLAVTITAPSASQHVRDSVLVKATPSELVTKVQFTLAGQTVEIAAAPYETTLNTSGLPDGTVTINVLAIGLNGETASATRDVIVDHTPPAKPDDTKITAEPPGSDGRSLVYGRSNAVEGNATVTVVNTHNNATASVQAATDGSFSLLIAGAADDPLTITPADTVGNIGPAATIFIRRTPSLPPATGVTTLRYEGLLVDKVGPASAAINPDSNLDAVFTLSLSVGNSVTRQLSYIDLVGNGTRSTRPGNPVLGVAVDPGAPLLNFTDGHVSMPVTEGATLTLFAADAGFIRPGTTYTVTAVFTDNSRFVATCLLPSSANSPHVPHSATVTAAPATVTVNGSTAGTTVLTVTNIRDFDGVLVPDGAKVALSPNNGATVNGTGAGITSVGGTIVDGVAAANNPIFKVFTVSGGQFTATYSSGSVVPATLTGTLATVQLIAADENNNTIGTQAIASIDINIKSNVDRAIISMNPTSLYGDKADRRAHITVRVRDAAGNPAPNGTKVRIGASNCFSTFSNGVCIGSVGGAIIGGPVFTVNNGVVEADYSSAGLLATRGVVSTATIAVNPADTTTGNQTSTQPLGLASMQIVGPAASEVEVSPSMVTWVEPSALPSRVRVHHLHDARGNLAPEDAKILLSAGNCATVFPNGVCFGSAGGAITDGVPSSSNPSYRVFSLNLGEVQATYSSQGVAPVGINGSVTANVQVAQGDATGALAAFSNIGVASVQIVGAAHVLGSVEKPTLFADGALQTTTVTFGPILDTNGVQIPDGTKVVLSAGNCAMVFSNGVCIGSAGGQILDGAASPSGTSYKAFTIANGRVTATFGNQGLTVVPGSSITSTVTITPARADGSFITSVALGSVSITSIGTTSATGSVSPATIHADGSDFRSTVTFANIKDRDGRTVPDGTRVALTVKNCATTFSNGVCVGSAGGDILDGDAAGFGGGQFRIFTVQNGQIVATYSSRGVVANSDLFATISAVSVSHTDQILSTTTIATTTVKLVAPKTATVTVEPLNVSATGVDQSTQITISGLKDSDPSINVPDGSLIGLAIGNCASTFSNGVCVGSAGGLISPVGTMPNDGAVATNNANYKLFTVKDGQVKAIYSTTTGVVANNNQTLTATVQVVPANSSGALLSTTNIGTGQIRLNGTTSTTASGPATVARNGGTGTIVFSAIKDAVGNVVPDGTLVVATVNDCALVFGNGVCVSSAGGTITNGSASSTGGFRVFTVSGGAVSVDYSSNGANSSNTVRVGLTVANPSGARISSVILMNGVWTLTLN